MAKRFIRVEPPGEEFPESTVDSGLADVQRKDKAAEDRSQAIQMTKDLAPMMMRTAPAEDFNPDAPDEYPVWQGAKGFTANLDDPMRLIADESAGANLIKWLTGRTDEAVQLERNQYRLHPDVAAINDQLSILEDEGKVDTPEYAALIDEIEKVETDLNGRPENPEFSFAAIKEAYNQDPGAFTAEFANAIMTDPELMATPIGWRLAATRAGAALTAAGARASVVTAGKVAAGATGTAAAGAAVTGGIEASKQLGQAGEITDPGQIGEQAAIGGAAAAVLTGAFKGIQRGVSGAKAKFQTEPLPDEALPIRASDALAKLGEDFDFKKASSYGEIQKAFDLDEEIRAIQKSVDEDVAFALMAEKNKAFRGRFGQELDPGEKAMAKATRTASVARSQAGKASPEVLAATAFIGAGAVGGSILADDPLVGAAAGAGAAVGALLAGRTLSTLGKGVVNGFKHVRAPDNRIRIDHLTNQWEGDIAVNARSSWQVKMKMMEDVPNIKDREAIAHFLEGDTSVKLSKEATATAKFARQAFDILNKIAKDEDVIDTYLENYVPHIWRQKGKSKSEIIATLMEDTGGAGGMKTTTRHAKKRTIPTLAKGIELGLEPQTTDIAEILKIYTDGLYRAIRNKQLAQALRDEIAPNGLPMVGKEGTVPANYQQISHPQFIGERVHPDIVPSLNFIYHSSDPNVISRGVQALNFAMKRSLVSMSFFHANALVESMIYAGINPAGKKLPSALDMLRHGGAGDMVDTALRAGLKIGAIEDVGSDVFYAAVRDLEKVANDIVPIAGGATVRAYGWLNKKVDTIMWDKIATGGKLAVFSNEMEKALLKNAADHAKNPKKFPIIPKEQLATDIAEYVNDAFGGLNWRQIAEGTKTKLGRDVALAAFSPGGRKAMQLAMFAPDWTIANIRVLLKAIPGQAKNKRIARLHQYYAARGALFFATLGSAVNMMYTGKPIWENEDPTTVDMGDGRKMTFSKQFVEPYHWLEKPGQTAINKMGILPKTALELSKGVKYFSGRASDPPLYTEDAGWIEKRAAEAGLLTKKFTPIFAQQVADQGVSGFAGFLGHPIYGKKSE